MHLKALEIQGFKSFPERTVIEFHEGVTAIIGPNGSGKSNVTDAIRWVLGEQSVKTLRGSRMEDVIFSGTTARRAMSFAEVTMTIDNSDGKLPLEYSEVQVTRRLYRSGESEYLLNRTTCRLRDIAMLFMDTGMGRDGYSIVGQGRVDDILSHRSEDRRKIFEEASGIVKYKTRKEEAERKLQNTEQNLLRINDIIRELEDRIEPLAEQAAVAKRYLALRDELKGIEIALMLESIDQHRQSLDDAVQEKDLLEKDLLRENSVMLDIKEQNRQSQEKIRQVDERIEQGQQEFNQINLRINELNSQIAINDERIHQLHEQLRLSHEAELDLGRGMGDLSLELANRRKKEDTLKRQLETYRKQLNDAENEMLQVLQTLDSAEKKIEQLKVHKDQLLESLYEKRSVLAQTKGQTDHVQSRRKAIENELLELTSDYDRLQLLTEETEEQIRTFRQQEQIIQENRRKASDDLEKYRFKVNTLSSSLEEEKRQLQNHQYRFNTLTELEKSYEGYGEAVRRLFNQAGSDPAFAQGIRGTLGSLIQVEQAYELAVETALGPAIQNIVTDNEKTAERLIDFLKTTRSGRATFLPIASIRSRSLEDRLLKQLSSMPGYVGIASRLVQADPDLREILDFLLGRVVFSETLDQAVQMSRKTGYACRIVTLDGDVVNPGGSMTGGFNRAVNAGVLGRGREINKLKLEIDRLVKVVADLEKDLPGLNLSMQENARILAQLDKKSIEQSHLIIKEEARLTALQQEKEKTAARRQMMKAEDEQLQSQTEQIENEIKRIHHETSQMESEINRIRKTVQDQEDENKSEQERRDDLREKISDLRVSFHSVEESLQAAEEMKNRLEQEQQDVKIRLDRHHQDQETAGGEIDRLTTVIEAFRNQVAEKQLSEKTCSEEVRKLISEKSALESGQAAYFDHLEAVAGRLAALQGEISRAEGKISRFENLSDDVKNKLWEDYEMTADQAAPWRRSLDNKTNASRQVSALKSSIRQLGPVNIAAIEENDTVAERLRFISAQRDDIEDARHQLTSVIDDLAEAMKKQFVNHFSRINENFKTVFSELFNGGTAEVSLEDEKDVLTCGIEIHAQPPGKKLQNLSLLSGGERCLTANALLFAILKLRPTPFCVLDEVEAALDDVNISRFTDYVRRYSDESQFILVTHRKGTMEAADRLYGVTMQERGVSRILSMELTD